MKEYEKIFIKVREFEETDIITASQLIEGAESRGDEWGEMIDPFLL